MEASDSAPGVLGATRDRGCRWSALAESGLVEGGKGGGWRVSKRARGLAWR